MFDLLWSAHPEARAMPSRPVDTYTDRNGQRPRVLVPNPALAGATRAGDSAAAQYDPRSTAMRQSKLFGRTLREAPAEAQTTGHRLMLRAAIAKPLAAGLYTWLPLGFRVQKKVEQIIREE